MAAGAEVPTEDRSEPVPGAAPAMGPGTLEAGWERLVRRWQRADAWLSWLLDWITARFLGMMVRLRLIGVRAAGEPTHEHATPPGLAASAHHLDLALRLLVTAVYLAVLPLFAFAWWLTAATRCADCWFTYLPQAYVLIPIVGALCGLTRLRQRPVPLGQDVERATLALVGGLYASALGAVVWLIYAALGERLPYPSPADAGYIASLLLWMLATLYIYRSQHSTLVGELGPLAPLASATMFIVVSVVLFVTRDLQFSSGNLVGSPDMGKIALNVAYPILGIFNFTFLAALLAGRVFDTLSGDMQKGLVCLALGMFFNLLADTAFAVSTTLALKGLGWSQVSWASNVEDWVYASGLALVSVGMLLLNSDRAEIADRAVEPR